MWVILACSIVAEQGTVWLVNDPWKKHYLDNIQCESNRQHYEQFSPLLFSLPIQAQWFE